MTKHQAGQKRVSSIADLGEAIRRRRRTLGLTQEDIAAQVGIARITVSAIENGKDTAHVGLVFQICRDLGLHLMIEEPRE